MSRTFSKLHYKSCITAINEITTIISIALLLLLLIIISNIIIYTWKSGETVSAVNSWVGHPSNCQLRSALLNTLTYNQSPANLATALLKVILNTALQMTMLLAAFGQRSHKSLFFFFCTHRWPIRGGSKKWRWINLHY